jgi:Na+/proline symporter
MTEPFVPEDPRLGRQRVLALYLRVALVVVALLATLTAVVPESVHDELGVVTVVVLIVVPIGRVVWLLVRWTRRGDRRFAAAAAVLLAVMALALVVAN